MVRLPQRRVQRADVDSGTNDGNGNSAQQPAERQQQGPARAQQAQPVQPVQSGSIDDLLTTVRTAAEQRSPRRSSRLQRTDVGNGTNNGSGDSGQQLAGHRNNGKPEYNQPSQPNQSNITPSTTSSQQSDPSQV